MASSDKDSFDNDQSFTVAEDGARPSVRVGVVYKFFRGDEVWVCLPGQDKHGPYYIDEAHNKPGSNTLKNYYSLCDEFGNAIMGGDLIAEENLEGDD